MRRDDRDDPFEDFFEEIERMMGGFGPDEPAGPGETRDARLRIDDEGDVVRVVGDLPGVDREDVEIKCDGRNLTVRANAGRRTYEERVTLPARVNEHTASASFNNGVLEVRFDRADDSADIDLS